MNTPIRLQKLIAAVSILLFIAKLGAWYLTHSVAILTDALESTVNVITGLIGLYSVLLAAKPRDENHPYGHGKVEFISAAIEGALIFISGLMIIYEAINQLVHNHKLNYADLKTGIVIIVFTGFINLLLGRYAIGIGKKNRSITVEAAGRHLSSDAYSTFAIIAGLALVLFFKLAWLDGIIAIVFAVIILVTGYRVIRKSLAGIMDEADVALLHDVIEVLQNHRKEAWIDMHNLRVVQYGDVLHVDAHMTLPWYYQVKEAEQENHALEELVKKHFGNKVEMFVHIDACMPYQCKLCKVEHCPVRQEPFKQQIVWNEKNVWADEKHGKDSSVTPSQPESRL